MVFVLIVSITHSRVSQISFKRALLIVQCIDQLAKPAFRSRYAHTPFVEQSEGPMDTVASSQRTTQATLANHTQDFRE